MKNTIKAVCVIIGTMVGAGFASGKEIYIFFNQYGINGVMGILVSNILTGIIITKVLTQIKEAKVRNYKEYLENLKINIKIKEIINIIVNIFLLISFYIMIAGFCAYFKQEFNISPYIIGIIVCTICYFTFKNKIEGITKINTILIPFLVIMIVAIGIKGDIFNIENIFNNMQNIENSSGNWFIASLEYASYNSIILIPILISIKKYTYKKEKCIGIIVPILFFILSIILFGILSKSGIDLKQIELPLIYIVDKFGDLYKYICGIIIVCAIYTSAIAAGYGFIENCSKNKKQYKIFNLIICISSFFVSKMGFSNLVNLLYPVFGLLGLIQLIYIMSKDIKKCKIKHGKLNSIK